MSFPQDKNQQDEKQFESNNKKANAKRDETESPKNSKSPINKNEDDEIDYNFYPIC
jgi:hypothetical protein